MGSLRCRQVYHARRIRLAEPRQVEANPEHMELLVSMGFSERGARHALVRSDNNLESAINLLTSMPAGWEPHTDANIPAAAGDADTPDAEAEAHAGEVNAGAQQHDQAGASIERQDTNGEAEAMSGAAVSMGTGGDGVADEPPMLQASATGSDVVSADEEQPLLGTHASGGASAIELSAVDMPGEDNEPRSGLEQGAPGDGDGGASELAVADVLQAQDSEHMPLDTPTMLELQEGMRGLMTALNATTAGMVNDAAAAGGGTGGGPMSGAMPILATGGGGDAASMLDPMRIVDEMRWGGAFPAMLGGLLAADVEEGGLAFDDYQSTVYADDDDGSEVDDDEEDEASDNEN